MQLIHTLKMRKSVWLFHNFWENCVFYFAWSLFMNNAITLTFFRQNVNAILRKNFDFLRRRLDGGWFDISLLDTAGSGRTSGEGYARTFTEPSVI